MSHPWSSQQFREGARAAGRSQSVIAAAEAAAAAIKQAHPDLPVILTLNHLAHLSGVAVDDLQAVIFRHEDPYRVFRVKKRGTPNGIAAPPRRFRTICVPTIVIMRVQRWIAQNVLNVIAPHKASFAFAPKRDLVGAAKRHLEAKWLVKMDVRHFFESISERQVYFVFRSLGYGSLLSFQLARLCTRRSRHLIVDPRSRGGRGKPGLPYRQLIQGTLPQGAPTSPMLANLVMRMFDERVEALALQEGWTYTRYADDLAFSRRDPCSRRAAIQLTRTVERQLFREGLKNNRQKTSIAPPGSRKIVLGLLVDREKPRLTREFRDNIETHLYALLSPKIGVTKHLTQRKFSSVIGMRRHIEGLIAFAHQVDKVYGALLYAQLDSVDWNS
jgi:RNA-directed DNA polymerase